jgi:hypothetical protein
MQAETARISRPSSAFLRAPAMVAISSGSMDMLSAVVMIKKWVLSRFFSLMLQNYNIQLPFHHVKNHKKHLKQAIFFETRARTDETDEQQQQRNGKQ